jgi:type IV secretory pathway TrbF-like protein
MKIILALFISLLALRPAAGQSVQPNTPPKIAGVNFVASVREIGTDAFVPVKQINASWVALVPYAMARQGKPELRYNDPRQWWGERLGGIAASAAYAKQCGLRVMLKPQVWLMGGGWTGDFALTTESDWQAWEKNYEGYVLPLAKLSDSLGIDMICIGTEYRTTVKQREAFWKNLIQKIRHLAPHAKLTYAANWDEYDQVPFWSDLDFIGINAYFPLTESGTPTAAELVTAWQKPLSEMRATGQKFHKPILLTEYGYRSLDKAARRSWEQEGWASRLKPANLAAQAVAYEALFRSLWQESWVAGGFLWKWYSDQAAGGNSNTDWTPQNKPAEAVIKSWYGKK